MVDPDLKVGMSFSHQRKAMLPKDDDRRDHSDRSLFGSMLKSPPSVAMSFGEIGSVARKSARSVIARERHDIVRPGHMYTAMTHSFPVIVVFVWRVRGVRHTA